MAAETPFERAIKLAVVTGLRNALGPALLAAAHDRPERKTLAMAAVGELVADKLPFMPSRGSLPLLVPRAATGAWVMRESLRHDGVEEPWALPVGAAVAAGAATFAPLIRNALHRLLGIPQPILGLAEDYLALRLGGDALGFSVEDLKQMGAESVADIQGHAQPLVDELKGHVQPLVDELKGQVMPMVHDLQGKLQSSH